MESRKYSSAKSLSGSIGSYKIRKAKTLDQDAVLEVRSDATVIEASILGKPISREAHVRWWEAHVRTYWKGCHIYVLVDELDRPVGVGRVDLDVNRREAEVSLGLLKSLQGRHLGRELLDHLIREARRLGAKSCLANIRLDNWRSIRLFLSAGFEAVMISLDHKPKKMWVTWKKSLTS